MFESIPKIETERAPGVTPNQVALLGYQFQLGINGLLEGELSRKLLQNALEGQNAVSLRDLLAQTVVDYAKDIARWAIDEIVDENTVRLLPRRTLRGLLEAESIDSSVDDLSPTYAEDRKWALAYLISVRERGLERKVLLWLKRFPHRQNVWLSSIDEELRKCPWLIPAGLFDLSLIAERSYEFEQQLSISRILATDEFSRHDGCIPALISDDSDPSCDDIVPVEIGPWSPNDWFLFRQVADPPEK